MVFTGRAASWAGDSKNSITVGPRLGNSHGRWTSRPIAPLAASTTRHSTAAYSPAPRLPRASVARSSTERFSKPAPAFPAREADTGRPPPLSPATVQGGSASEKGPLLAVLLVD